MIEAAGGVVWRSAGRGHQLEVLVVHRPRYDDWSLPKGKVHKDESILDAAVREVLEETGVECEVGALLGEVRYTDRKRRRKRVRYWAMRALSDEFVANDEVDEARWLRLDAAAAQLTYDHDVPVLVALRDLAPAA